MLELMYNVIFQTVNTLPIVSTFLTTTQYLFVRTVGVTSIVPYASFHHSCCYCMIKAVIIIKKNRFLFCFQQRNFADFVISSKTKYKNKQVYSCCRHTQIKEIIFIGVADTAFTICTMQLQNKFTELQHNIFENVMNSIFKSILKGGQFWPLGHKALH